MEMSAVTGWRETWRAMKQAARQAAQRCVAGIVAGGVTDGGASDGLLTEIQQRNIAEWNVQLHLTRNFRQSPKTRTA